MMKQCRSFCARVVTFLLITTLVTSSVLSVLAQEAATDAPYRGFLPLVIDAGQSIGSEAEENEAVAVQPHETTKQTNSAKIDQIILRLRKAARAANANRTALANTLGTAAGITLTYQREMSDNVIVLKLPSRMNADEVQTIAKRLAQLPDVELAQPDWILQRQVTPNDPRYPNQWHYFAPVANAYGINLPAAWDITTGSSNVVVAVLDTGILSHPDLNGHTVAGYDFVTDLAMANDGDGRDANPTDPGDWCDTDPSSWHGTHVAGTIGANSNNGIGVAGVNWQAKIQPVRVLGACGGPTLILLMPFGGLPA